MYKLMDKWLKECFKRKDPETVPATRAAATVSQTEKLENSEYKLKQRKNSSEQHALGFTCVRTENY